MTGPTSHIDEQMLRRSIEAMPAAQRRILLLCRVHGLSIAEAAAETGLSPPDIGRALARALAPLVGGGRRGEGAREAAAARFVAALESGAPAPVGEPERTVAALWEALAALRLAPLAPDRDEARRGATGPDRVPPGQQQQQQ